MKLLSREIKWSKHYHKNCPWLQGMTSAKMWSQVWICIGNFEGVNCIFIEFCVGKWNKDKWFLLLQIHPSSSYYLLQGVLIHTIISIKYHSAKINNWIYDQLWMQKPIFMISLYFV